MSTMQITKKTSLYDVVAATFPEAELFELDGDRQLVRTRAGRLDFESFSAALPLSGRMNYGAWRIHVFPTHPGYVCVALPPDTGGELETEAAVGAVAELYYSIDELQDDERSQSDGTTFLTHLFQMGASDPTHITLMAADMDLDLSLRRLVAVFRVTPASALDQAAEALRTVLDLSHQDIFGSISDDCVVCCKVVESGNETAQEYMRAYFNRVMDTILLPQGVCLSCGVGVPVTNMWEYPMGLRMARLALSEECPVSWAYEHILDYVTDRLTPDVIFHFLGQYFVYLENNPVMYDTIHALVKWDMDLAAAASDCAVHRNTLVFRLNQLRSVWNINPIQNDNDRFFLILLDHCYTLYGRENTAAPEIDQELSTSAR